MIIGHLFLFLYNFYWDNRNQTKRNMKNCTSYGNNVYKSKRDAILIYKLLNYSHFTLFDCKKIVFDDDNMIEPSKTNKLSK